MNTARSVWYGWGALCAAGGGAYYFAKKSVNAERKARFEAQQRQQKIQESLEHSTAPSAQPSTSSRTRKPTKNIGPARTDQSGSSIQEVNLDPAPTRHAPDAEGQRVLEKSKYEPSEPFRATKGDRFS